MSPQSSALEFPAARKDQDLEFWKHFAAMGAKDKNTMVTTATWLIGFGAGGIGYVGSELIKGTVATAQIITVCGLTFLISIVAALVVLTYGGYSNQNWALADRIARRNEWIELLPELEFTVEPRIGHKTTPLAASAWQWGRPCFPEEELAPIFQLFFFLASLLAVVSAVFIIWAPFAN